LFVGAARRSVGRPAELNYVSVARCERTTPQ
jgi:hypothetical protein